MGYSSLKFKNIEKYLIAILKLIQQNQNILRYIKYLNDNPLDTSNPNITSNLVKDGNIIPTMFDITLTNIEEVKMFIYPKQGSLKDKPLGDVFFHIDILIPDEHWTLSGLGQFRAFRIADEITQMIDGQSEIAGTGQINVVDFNAFKLTSSNYTVLSLRVLVNSCTLKG